VVMVLSPNAALPGPTKAREMAKEKGIPCIVISDAPALKAKDKLKEDGFGFIIIPGDPMIGARREFLDPVEMAIFNVDVMSVLATTGVVKLVADEIDRVITEIRAGGEVKLPQIVATAEKAVAAAGFSNPYAKAKAIAAYSMAEKVAELDVKGCFMMKEPEKYVPIVAAAHELLGEAAKLAKEAREIEKYSDSVLRMPHSRKGEILKKTKLMEKPSA